MSPLPETERRGEWGVTTHGHRVSFWVDEYVLKLNSGDRYVIL